MELNLCGKGSDGQKPAMLTHDVEVIQLPEQPIPCIKRLRRQECSFLKKRTKRLLLLRRFHDRGHGRDLAAGVRSKSLLLLFFRKEELP
jgi:hypothetical protein